MASPLFFFDFDMTLTLDHTGGTAGMQFTEEDDPVCDSDGKYVLEVTPDMVTEFFGTTDWIQTIVSKFQEIKKKHGGKIFINTRGIVACVEEFLKKTGEVTDLPIRNLIDGVLGANTIEEVECEDQGNNDVEFWATKKVQFIEEVMTKHNLSDKNLVFFYDDTLTNIQYAQEKGFMNAVQVRPATLIENIDKHLGTL